MMKRWLSSRVFSGEGMMMAREIKPGKKFKYDLEPVLKVRKIRERQEQEEFSKRQRDFLTEQEKQEKIEAEKRAREGELRTILRKGPISDFERILRRKHHLGVLKEEKDKQVEKTLAANKKMEEQREKLIVSMKDRKLIDRHKEHRFKRYKEVMNQLEGKVIDEIAVIRHARKGA